MVGVNKIYLGDEKLKFLRRSLKMCYSYYYMFKCGSITVSYIADIKSKTSQN
jgi:hypothetical protein